jgi:mono/diheme cytochrome c family protein
MWLAAAGALVVCASAAIVPGAEAQQLSPPPTAATPIPPIVIDDADLRVRAAKARELAHTYSEKLRTGLIKALKEGGPVGAIGACNTLAPELNNTITESSTFEITRTALRVRNPENAPDPWEQAVLEQFQTALATGGDSKSVESYDVVTTQEGQKLFRYMRPITMREPCLACHGPNVAADVKAEIAKYYNDDKAIGFNIGELRGAFSLVQQLD